MSKPLRIAMVAGEPSGDVLAAGMVGELKRLYPDAIIEGIGGPNMQAQGFHSLFDMETLSVMGLVEVLSHLPAILKVKKALLAHFSNNPPDIFVGIDAPDFNLRVEKELKAKGIKTIHYVSPTIWAWREKRVHKIAKAAGRVLGLFPFEQQVYDKYDVPYTFVGHTMADSIALTPDQQASRKTLNLPIDKPVLAVLPGSRRGEVDTLLPIFIKTMEKIAAQRPDVEFVIPAANTHRLEQINSMLKEANNVTERLPIHVTEGTSRDAMIASDVILLASGTATLEAMLCKRPMVVAYKLSPITYKIMQRLYKAPFFALPNLLANEALVPELLQDDVNPDTLSQQALTYFDSDNTDLISRFTDLHHTLKCNADKTAAQAVVEELFA
ncbi:MULTISPECIES: lipid-A-disaccharide synthase [Alteromonas]|jgi:lipid-A-disaccharide synthase|uniref:Lipid-A-disaccharide synthase n=1 Tax=Alteromonas stellipolaris TaxID=233316 RepID=A0AAW7Z3X0_9ALTE|nr:MULTISPECIES: lipid-A-disaccharide synthase [Alteromonas]AMJ89870.1 lipid-A-disaccharide synthase [Alteromonas sp. Mac2]ALM91540.1 Lipid-A-disaccharide synthase [Alteromonas stellipolaris LMG 21856]AMJ73579.1 lipid-A-disaccharide synthase [Alteromonas stellipolaris]AMJ86014.1 lipid-A-disaccharide synthase [Alteromonas sp. Mac1]ANB23343.1 lipid-A-disaccharide synthase [Alteromonas stellipolaris]